MTELRAIMAHLAACAALEALTGSCQDPALIAGAVDGSQEGCPTSMLKEALAPYGARGNIEDAALALAAWQRGPQDLGRLYQLAKKKAAKKELGQVFTPQSAVKGTLDLLSPEIGPVRICDPACGAGDFLLEAARRWPEANLSGWDIDPLALAVANSRLVLAGARSELEQADSLLLPGDKPELVNSFDLVLGNPPWGGKQPQPRGYTIQDRTQANPFVWFIELAYRILKDDGQLALILPEAWLKVFSYKQSRSWFLERFSLTALCYSPKVFAGYYAPAVFLSAEKNPRKAPVSVWYQSQQDNPARYHNTIPPQGCTPEIININYHPEIEDIWHQCQVNALYLEEGELGGTPTGPAVVDFSLGIVTGDNNRFVSSEKQSDQHLPLLCAKDVAPFKIQSPSCWLKYDSHQLQQAAPLAKYQVKEKIVYKFIAREVVAAVDRSGALTLNNLNIMVPLHLPFSLDYLAALLNSELLGTLYMYRFFTGKVLTRNLKQLPLQLPSPGIEDKLLALVHNQEKTAVEDLIYDLYKISQRQKKLIQSLRQGLLSMFFI